MAKSVLITLTTAGTSTGNFELFSDVDGYVTPFETGVLKSALLAGYTSILVPDAATIIRVQSDSGCTNFIDLSIVGITTTTTTTLAPTTTTTTTSSGPCDCINYIIENISGSTAVVPFTNCFTGLPDSITILAGGSASFCACSGSVPSSPGVTPIALGPCPTTTTTTATPTTTTTSTTTSTTSTTSTTTTVEPTTTTTTTAEPIPGTFLYRNVTASGVTDLFDMFDATVTTGSVPVGPGQSIGGTHLGLNAGGSHFNIWTTTAGSISIYVNSILIYCIDTPAGAPVSNNNFTNPVQIFPTDYVLIEYSDNPC